MSDMHIETRTIKLKHRSTAYCYLSDKEIVEDTFHGQLKPKLQFSQFFVLVPRYLGVILIDESCMLLVYQYFFSMLTKSRFQNERENIRPLRRVVKEWNFKQSE